MFDKEAGYAMTAEVDKILNRLLERFEPEWEENTLGYMALIRTIRTTLDLIEYEVENS